ncbi:hypothetical protein [Zobellella denitrificans]|uniref:hypothetical protein n=1 Tax=Zobellella denitrificans TaxID=347534 RepID=UPI0012FD90F4|nr:hypothetical protein [Zobellella denitrificans]
MARWLLLATLLLGLSACSLGRPLEYHSDREIPPGPGLVTGERGALTLETRQPH